MLKSQRIRRVGALMIAAGVLAGSGLVIAAASGSTPRVPSRPTITPQPMGPVGAGAPANPIAFNATSIRTLAVGVANGAGDATPTGIQAIQTTRGKASQIVEPGMPSSNQTTDSTPVVVVTMTGHFVENGAPVPEGDSPPTGTSLTVTYDAATGAPLDMNLRDPTQSSPPPDLTTAGTPVLAVTNSVTADLRAAHRLGIHVARSSG